MLTVSTDDDKVVLDLGGRRRDVLLTPLQAERLADGLDEHASVAERAATRLVRGERWDCRVDQMDRLVVLCFCGPDAGLPEQVPMPAVVARKLAELLREKSELAGYGVAISGASARLAGG